MIENHMVTQEDNPTQSELNLALDIASKRVRALEELAAAVEKSISEAANLDMDTDPLCKFFLYISDELKKADVLFEIAFAKFTTGELDGDL